MSSKSREGGPSWRYSGRAGSPLLSHAVVRIVLAVEGAERLIAIDLARRHDLQSCRSWRLHGRLLLHDRHRIETHPGQRWMRAFVVRSIEKAGDAVAERVPLPEQNVNPVELSALRDGRVEASWLPDEVVEGLRFGALQTALHRGLPQLGKTLLDLSLIHISEPTRQAEISYAVFCLKKKK